jgi:hypothetical protein
MNCILSKILICGLRLKERSLTTLYTKYDKNYAFYFDMSLYKDKMCEQRQNAIFVNLKSKKGKKSLHIFSENRVVIFANHRDFLGNFVDYLLI